MKVTIALSTNRPHYWQRFCENVSHNSVQLELIFVGPSSLENLPRLTIKPKFISTNALPALCWEIGARAATGDLLCLSGDDFCYEPGFFDHVVAAAKLRRAKYDMFTGRYVHNGKEQAPGQMMLSGKNMPLLPVAGVGYTEDHHKLGGIDKRFQATLWDTDLYQRFFQAGGGTTLLPGHAIQEIGTDSTMFVKFSEIDKVILKQLWFKNGQPTLERSSPIQSYSNDEAGQPLTIAK